MSNTTMGMRWTPAFRALASSICFGLLLALVAAPTQAEETSSGKTKAEPGAAPAGTTAGPVEGLRVHGHWTIEVREPDGTLVMHREFENALVIPTGATHLANIMGRARTVGGWRINTVGTVQICENPSGGAATSCEMIESTDGLISNAAFKTLTVGVSASTPATMVLDGSLVAQRTGDISQVRTFNLYCGNATSPAGCPSGTVLGSDMVTSTVLGTPIAVTVGQQVQVRVVISLS